MRGLILRKTRESMSESVLVTYETKVVPADSSILKGPNRRLRAAYVYPNGSTIVVGGMDKSSKVMSTDYDMICVFEGTELIEGEFEDLTTRLRNGIMPYQQIIIDCNPGAPTHWLNMRPNKGHMTRLLSRHEDNPVLYNTELKDWTLPGEKYIAKLDRLSGNRKLRLRYGKWAAAEGMVYPEWDRATHVLKKRFAIPPHWKRFCSIDFGYTTPFVCQWWAVDDDGRMFMYREIYFSGRLVREHAKQIKFLSRGEYIYDTVCDHDSENRASLEDEGIPTTLAYKDIERGIDQVKGRLVPSGDGRPRIFFLPDSRVEQDPQLMEDSVPTSTIEEFDGYVWKKTTEAHGKQSVPVDKDDHGMDTMRYAVSYQDGLLGTRFITTLDEAAIVTAAQVNWDPYSYSEAV